MQRDQWCAPGFLSPKSTILDENVEGMINTFTDDTKIGGIIDSEGSYSGVLISW